MFYLLLSSAYCQGLFCSSPHPTSEQAGGAQEAGRGHSQDSWPQLTKGMSHTIGHHAQHIKLGEEEVGGWTFGVCPPKYTIMCDGAQHSWGWLITCLPMGSSEWIPCFAVLVYRQPLCTQSENLQALSFLEGQVHFGPGLVVLEGHEGSDSTSQCPGALRWGDCVGGVEASKELRLSSHGPKGAAGGAMGVRSGCFTY